MKHIILVASGVLSVLMWSESVQNRNSMNEQDYGKPTGTCFVNPETGEVEGCLCPHGQIPILVKSQPPLFVCAKASCQKDEDCPTYPTGNQYCFEGSDDPPGVCVVTCHTDKDCVNGAVCGQLDNWCGYASMGVKS